MTGIKPYFDDGQVQLFVGDCREILPALGVTADLVLADPPYGETSFAWDRWPEGWLQVAASVSRSLWCFGSLRMYLKHGGEFSDAGWKFSQDIIWEKHNGSGSANDRFKRVHEQPTHWYRGAWGDVHHVVPTTADAVSRQVRRKNRPTHWGDIGGASYESEDGGPRLMRSVIFARSMHGRAIHKTQKPGALLEPMIAYGCPPGGLVVDPFSGSGSALVIARQTGRRGIGIELREPQVEESARWLAQLSMDGGAPDG
jgi:site-specific DNA-methyltransferase (adenine-specific)